MRKLLLALTLATFVGVGSAVAAAGPPQNTAKPTISGAARQPQTLTADRGTWSGTQPISYAFQWMRCDSNGNSCARIVGATATANTNTYKLTSTDVNNTVRVRVRASNSGGAATATSNATAVVKSQASAAVSLDSDTLTATYGRSVELTGTVDNADAGEAVTIVERRSPAVRGLQVRTITGVKTASDGTFRATVRPLIHATYTAEAAGNTSNAVPVNVRPLVKLTHAGFHRYMVRAWSARSFRGKVAVLQRWNASSRHWVSIKRVRFSTAVVGTTSVTSRAIFRAAPGRVKIRINLSRGQTRPGYSAAI